MSKHNYQRALSAATALVALAVLAAVAGCDGGKAAREADAERTADASAGQAGASIAEVRHFEAYNRYRMMFDDAADHVALHGHDIRPALAIHDDVHFGVSSSGCFLGNRLDAD